MDDRCDFEMPPYSNNVSMDPPSGSISAVEDEIKGDVCDVDDTEVVVVLAGLLLPEDPILVFDLLLKEFFAFCVSCFYKRCISFSL